jgi:4-carboxymuconolactone decarboxylase
MKANFKIYTTHCCEQSNTTPHLHKGKANGLTKEEIAEIITHLSFYTGWPKAWPAFNIAKEIYKDEGKQEMKYGK